MTLLWETRIETASSGGAKNAEDEGWEPFAVYYIPAPPALACAKVVYRRLVPEEKP